MYIFVKFKGKFKENHLNNFDELYTLPRSRLSLWSASDSGCRISSTFSLKGQ
jgi:hypothetical protein